MDRKMLAMLLNLLNQVWICILHLNSIPKRLLWTKVHLHQAVRGRVTDTRGYVTAWSASGHPVTTEMYMHMGARDRSPFRFTLPLIVESSGYLRSRSSVLLGIVPEFCILLSSSSRSSLSFSPNLTQLLESDSPPRFRISQSIGCGAFFGQRLNLMCNLDLYQYMFIMDKVDQRMQIF